MAEFHCTECGAPLPYEGSKFCRICGGAQRKETEKRKQEEEEEVKETNVTSEGASNTKTKYIQIKCDNTTAISNINMGGIPSS